MNTSASPQTAGEGSIMDPTSTFYMSAEAAVGSLSFVGNSLVAAALVKKGQGRFIKKIFTVNMVAADTLVGLLVAPMTAIVYAGLPRHIYGCAVAVCVIVVVTHASILARYALALETYLAIFRPSIYEVTKTVFRCIVINILLWVTCILTATIPILRFTMTPDEMERCNYSEVITLQYSVYFQFLGLVLVPLVLVTLLNVHAFIKLRRFQRKRKTFYNMFVLDGDIQTTLKSSSEFKKELKSNATIQTTVKLHAAMQNTPTLEKEAYSKMKLDNVIQNTLNKSVRTVIMVPVLLLVFLCVLCVPVSIVKCVILFCVPCELPGAALKSHQLMYLSIALPHRDVVKTGPMT